VARVTSKRETSGDDGTWGEAFSRGAIPKSPRVVVLWEGGEAQIAAPLYGSISIGRASTCDLIIQHRSVSRVHAKLHAVRDGFVIEDLGSSNGTRVQGEPLERGARTPVTFGDVVEIGATLLTFQDGGPIPSELPPPAEPSSPKMLVADPAMSRLMQLVETIAPGAVSVVIRGEIGVGKELVAETIHRLSGRAGGPLLRLDCAALSGDLLERELFGYDEGAGKTKIGLLEAANQGTVLLVDIGEMSLAAQDKLLHVLESREVTRMGGLAARSIDVRFLASTHRDLADLVKKSRFRADLYVRLNGVTIEVPPLRDRPSEVLPLFERFVASASYASRKPTPEIAPAAFNWLRQYTWPGNVRELKSVAERAAVVANTGIVRVEHLAPTVADTLPIEASHPESDPQIWRAQRVDPDDDIAEKVRILEVLAQCSGNQTRAAQILGISRRTLVNRLDAYNIARPRKGG